MKPTFAGEELPNRKPAEEQDIIKVPEAKDIDPFEDLLPITRKNSHELHNHIALLARMKHTEPARYVKLLGMFEGTVGFRGLDSKVKTHLDKVQKAHQSKAVQRMTDEAIARAGEDGKYLVNANSPLDMARTFLGTMRPNLIQVGGEWVDYVGNCYASLEKGQVKADLYVFLDKCVNTVESKAKKKGEAVHPDRKIVNDVTDAVEGVVFHATDDQGRVARWLEKEPGDANPANIVACSNCLVDVSNEKPYPLTPRLFTRNGLTFPYRDPWESPPPTEWLRFLAQVWPGSEGQVNIDALQEIIGLLLTADTSHQKIFLLIGPPRCGKGTIGRVIVALLGARNVTSPSMRALSQDFGMEQLLGKTLMLVSDMRIGARADVAGIAEKLLNISGEDSVSANRKFKDAENGKLLTRILLLSNDMLNLRDMSGAILTRLFPLVINTSALGKEDRQLTDRLLLELPAILNWAIVGRQRLNARPQGFVMPEKSKKLMAITARATSPVHEFIRQWCQLGVKEYVVKGALFDAYEAWCEDEGIASRLIPETFSRELLSASGYAIDTMQKRIDGKVHRIYAGISLKPEYAERANTDRIT